MIDLTFWKISERIMVSTSFFWSYW